MLARYGGSSHRRAGRTVFLAAQGYVSGPETKGRVITSKVQVDVEVRKRRRCRYDQESGFTQSILSVAR